MANNIMNNKLKLFLTQNEQSKDRTISHTPV